MQTEIKKRDGAVQEVQESSRLLRGEIKKACEIKRWERARGSAAEGRNALICPKGRAIEGKGEALRRSSFGIKKPKEENVKRGKESRKKEKKHTTLCHNELLSYKEKREEERKSKIMTGVKEKRRRLSKDANGREKDGLSQDRGKGKTLSTGRRGESAPCV